jgi:phosphoserine phosphatase
MLSKAAFYDVDGTLVRTNIVHTYAYYAMNRGSLSGIAGRTFGALASLPLFGALDAMNRKVFNEFFYRYYSGLSEDRLVTLAEDLFEDVLKPAIFPKAQDLIDEAKKAGCRIVLVTGALDFTVISTPFAGLRANKVPPLSV